MQELPPRRTLNGKFDAYCRVCWNAVYVLWIDKEDHEGKCLDGHTKATDCPEAMARAKLQAQLAKLREEGLIGPLKIPGGAI